MQPGPIDRPTAPDSPRFRRSCARSPAGQAAPARRPTGRDARTSPPAVPPSHQGYPADPLGPPPTDPRGRPVGGQRPPRAGEARTNPSVPADATHALVPQPDPSTPARRPPHWRHRGSTDTTRAERERERMHRNPSHASGAGSPAIVRVQPESTRSSIRITGPGLASRAHVECRIHVSRLHGGVLHLALRWDLRCDLRAHRPGTAAQGARPWRALRLRPTAADAETGSRSPTSPPRRTDATSRRSRRPQQR